MMSRKKHEDTEEKIEAIELLAIPGTDEIAKRLMKEVNTHTNVKLPRPPMIALGPTTQPGTVAKHDDAATLRAAILEHKQAAWRTYGHPRPCDLKLYGVLD
jgi:hypothetical protein